MEIVYLQRRNGCHGDESAAPEFSGRSEEDHHLCMAASELHSDLSQTGCKQPFSSQEMKTTGCQSCQKSPCSCSGEPLGSDECPTVPAKMMILELLIRSLRHPRKTHNVSDLDDLVSEAAASTGNLALTPSEKMVLDSLHAFVNARKEPSSPSLILPGAKTRKIRSRSHIATQTEMLELISPEMGDASTPQASPLKRTPELSLHEKMFLSCSSKASVSSNQSAWSSDRALNAGLLHCIWKDGLPHFEFSQDNPIVVYTANPVKVQSDNKKALDYVYLFHSGEQGRKDWIRNASNALKFIGKMKATSSLILNSDKSSVLETEFVLFGSGDDCPTQMNSSSTVTRGKGLAKRVAEMIRPGNFSSSPRHPRKFGKSCSQQIDDMSELLEGELNSAKESHQTNLITDDLPTNHELAAIVVTEHRHERREEPAVGGWGLKFLEKAGATHSESSEGTETNAQSRTKNARCINVVVPSGYHGGAVCQNGGPTSLIERWKSGGHCDCGGWDLGCPIRVLSNGYNGSLPQAESQDCTSMDLSIKGVKNEPILRLVNITADLYILYFDSSLSPLQCFSTGIAIVHSQTPNLYPTL